ncbi:MAG: hypothetical protein ACE5OP_03770, partial [Candidatus Glassbacteria bacterium]
WVDYSSGRGELYYGYYNGSTWTGTGPASVPPPIGTVNQPDFAIDDLGNTFLVWVDVMETKSVLGMDRDPSP